MAWIESHQELRNHKKTVRLSRKLNIEVYAAIGLLHCLWWWAIDSAPDGDLTDLEAWEIANAAAFDESRADELKEALIYAGFLDNDEDGLFIHDWFDYGGKTANQRIEQNERTKEKNRERQQKFRDKNKKHNANVTLRVTDDVTLRNAGVTDSVTLRNDSTTDGVTLRNAPTEHNITVHNNTLQESSFAHEGVSEQIPFAGEEALSMDEMDALLNAANTTKYEYPEAERDTGTLPVENNNESGGAAENKKLDLQTERFNEFWSLYPKKRSKKDAMKVWKKLKPTGELYQKIITQVKYNMDNNPDWRKDNGQFIPYPATWLNAGGWEDEIFNGLEGNTSDADTGEELAIDWLTRA